MVPGRRRADGRLPRMNGTRRITPDTRASLLRLLPAVLWAAVIFAGSSVPGGNVPGGWSVEGHFLEYAVLGALAMLAVGRNGVRAKAALVVLLVCSLYGVTDEFHQSFVPGRMPDPMDWMVDTVGASVGISLMLARAWWARRRAA